MRRFFIIALLMLLGQTALASGAPEASPQGDAIAGASKAGACAACHGFNGNSANPEWPSLAGQGERYIVTQLTAFHDGTRKNPLMSPMAANLSAQDMLDIAAYYASQTAKVGEADPSLVKHGEQLFQGGDLNRQIPACKACHGPAGLGMPAAGYPALSGQMPNYTIAQLKAYRYGSRTTGPNNMMQNVAKMLTDHDIAAVASYLRGLHR